MICPDGCGLDVPDNHAMPEKEPMIVKKRRSEVTTSQFEFGKMSYQQLKDSHDVLLDIAKKTRTFLIAEHDGYSNEIIDFLDQAIAQSEEKP